MNPHAQYPYHFGYSPVLEPEFDAVDADDACFIAGFREAPPRLISGGLSDLCRHHYEYRRDDERHILPWVEHSQPPKGVVPEPRPKPPMPPKPQPEPPPPPPLAMPMVASSVATHKSLLPYPLHVLMSICTPEQFGLLMRKYGMTAEEAKAEFRREIAAAVAAN